MPETVYDVLEERGLTEQDLPGYTGVITTDPADYEVGAGTYAGQVTELLTPLAEVGLFGALIGLFVSEGDDENGRPGILDKLTTLGSIAVLIVAGVVVLVVLK